MVWYLPSTWFEDTKRSEGVGMSEDTGNYRRIRPYTITKTRQKICGTTYIEYDVSAIYQNKSDSEDYGFVSGKARFREAAIELCMEHARNENGFPLVKRTVRIFPFGNVDLFEFRKTSSVETL